jgi:hypothetical protein
MATMKSRISKEEALNFLLTYIVVERGQAITLDQLGLFNLSNLALRAVEQINASEGIIPHEIIESLGAEYLESL